MTGAARASEGQVDRLMVLAQGQARFFRSADGPAFRERAGRGPRDETYGLKSAAFRDWLIGGYFRECGAAPSAAVISRVLSTLEALARFDGGKPSVSIRVGRDVKSNGSAYYVDLGDFTGRAIEISAGGWAIVSRRPE